MTFVEMRTKMLEHFAEMTKDSTRLFEVSLDKDKLWDLYLESFPPEKNKIFRERREHDCSCCRHFIKTIGMWTGKLDCEESYIFENDILQDIDTGEYVVVQWFPEHSSFMVWRITINKIEFLYSFLDSKYKKLKVIGNVYDGQNLIDKVMGEFNYEL